MSPEAQEPTPAMEEPAGQSPDGNSIQMEEMIGELSTMLGEKDQQIAAQRIILKRQQKLIEDLQTELTKGK